MCAQIKEALSFSFMWTFLWIYGGRPAVQSAQCVCIGRYSKQRMTCLCVLFFLFVRVIDSFISYDPSSEGICCFINNKFATQRPTWCCVNHSRALLSFLWVCQKSAMPSTIIQTYFNRLTNERIERKSLAIIVVVLTANNLIKSIK